MWEFLEGQLVDGKYRLQKLLGSGGFGAVFHAEEVVAGQVTRNVAVKLIPQDPEHLAEQMQEVVAAASLDHPSLVRCFAPGEATLHLDGHSRKYLYLAMELAGESLGDRLTRDTLTPTEARDVIANVAAGLLFLHQTGAVHRDLKPANILSVGGRWKISDLGLIREMGAETAVHTRAPGTLYFMPPESFEGQTSKAWDIWSLGVVIVRALTGRYPFWGDNDAEVMRAITSRTSLLVEQLPIPFRGIAEGCLIRDRRQRWTAERVLAELGSLAVDEATSTGEVAIVAQDGTGTYTTISEAISEVRPGSRITVRPGIYEERLAIEKRVELCGEGPAGAVIVSGARNPVVSLRGDGMVIRNLWIRPTKRATGSSVVSVMAGRGLIESCRITGTAAIGVSVQGRRANPFFRKCQVGHMEMAGFSFSDYAQGTVEDTEIYLNGRAGVKIGEKANPFFRNCSIHYGDFVGVLVSERGRGLFDTCEIVQNHGPGIDILKDGNPLFRGCRVRHNQGSGVMASSTARGTIQECDLRENSGSAWKLRTGHRVKRSQNRE